MTSPLQLVPAPASDLLPARADRLRELIRPKTLGVLNWDEVSQILGSLRARYPRGRRNTHPPDRQLEQRILDLRSELAERDEDLAAARAANRDLMAQLNR
jgi:hypothetical protein